MSKPFDFFSLRFCALMYGVTDSLNDFIWFQDRTFCYFTFYNFFAFFSRLLAHYRYPFHIFSDLFRLYFSLHFGGSVIRTLVTQLTSSSFCRSKMVFGSLFPRRPIHTRTKQLFSFPLLLSDLILP